MGFVLPRAATVKNVVPWDVTKCSSEKGLRLAGIYCLYRYCQRVSQGRHYHEASGNFFLICIVGGGVQSGSTRHVGHLLAYCTCPR
jgi:hypothetical protein